MEDDNKINPDKKGPNEKGEKKDKLKDEEMDKASGGAFPTSVNSQITDSVT